MHSSRRRSSSYVKRLILCVRTVLRCQTPCTRSHSCCGSRYRCVSSLRRLPPPNQLSTLRPMLSTCRRRRLSLAYDSSLCCSSRPCVSYINVQHRRLNCFDARRSRTPRATHCCSCCRCSPRSRCWPNAPGDSPTMRFASSSLLTQCAASSRLAHSSIARAHCCSMCASSGATPTRAASVDASSATCVCCCSATRYCGASASSTHRSPRRASVPRDSSLALRRSSQATSLIAIRSSSPRARRQRSCVVWRRALRSVAKYCRRLDSSRVAVLHSEKK